MLFMCFMGSRVHHITKSIHLSLILALGILGSIVGCGGGSSPSENNPLENSSNLAGLSLNQALQDGFYNPSDPNSIPPLQAPKEILFENGIDVEAYDNHTHIAIGAEDINQEALHQATLRNGHYTLGVASFDADQGIIVSNIYRYNDIVEKGLEISYATKASNLAMVRVAFQVRDENNNVVQSFNLIVKVRASQPDPTQPTQIIGR